MDLIFKMTQLDLYLVVEDALGQQGWPRFAGTISIRITTKAETTRTPKG